MNVPEHTAVPDGKGLRSVALSRPSIDWRAVRTEFEHRAVTTVLATVTARGVDLAEVDDAMSLHHQVSDTDQLTDNLVDALRPVWAAVADEPDTAVLLAVYLYVRCQLLWELSGDADRIRATIEALHRSWRSAEDTTDPTARLPIDVLVEHTRSLLHCLAAENAVKCSCPGTLADEANAVADDATCQLARCADLTGAWAGYRDQFLVPVLRSHQVTYSCYRSLARGIRDWCVLGAPAAPALRRVLAELDRAERDPDVTRDVYASELRGHAAGLRALLARIDDPTVPDLVIDKAKIVYYYPFTIDEVDGERVCEVAAELAPGSLGDGREFRVAPTQLSDIWNAHGRRTSAYSGVTVTLPSISVVTSAGEVLDEHAASVRLSRLGNHVLRIERSFQGFTPHELNQALRRASPYMGWETVTEEAGSGRWRQFAEYVDDLGGRLVTALRSAAGKPAADPPHEPMWAVASDFQVLVKITEASVVTADGRSAADVGDVLAATGPLLAAPLQNLPFTLEEWVRFGPPPGGSWADLNLVDGTFGGFPGEFIGRTVNSTFLVMLDTPNWVGLGFEERIEFAASLPTLLESWRRELQAAIAAEKLDEPTMRSHDLSERRMLLQDRVRGIQEKISLLHSVDLWGSLPSRRLGERLLTSSGLPEIESEIDRTVAQVELHHERLEALIQQREDRRNRRYQTVVELVLALLAAASLADVLSLINELFVLKGRATAWWEVGVLSGISIVVVMIVAVIYKLRESRRPRWDGGTSRRGRRRRRGDSASPAPDDHRPQLRRGSA